MKTRPNNEMATVLRAAFRKSGLSIKQLSERSGVPYASVHGIVTGNRDPILSTVSRLGKVLGLKLQPVRRVKRKG
jgi:predicted transcriptional regulator